MTEAGIANLDKDWVTKTLEEIKRKYCWPDPINGCMVIVDSLVAADGNKALHSDAPWEVSVQGQTKNAEYKKEEVVRLVVVRNGCVDELMKDGYSAVQTCHIPMCISEDCVVPEKESYWTGRLSRDCYLDSWELVIRDEENDTIEVCPFVKTCRHTPPCKPKQQLVDIDECRKVESPEEIAIAECMQAGSKTGGDSVGGGSIWYMKNEKGEWLSWTAPSKRKAKTEQELCIHELHSDCGPGSCQATVLE